MFKGCRLKRDSQAPACTQYLTIGLHSVVCIGAVPVLYVRHELAMSWTPFFVYFHLLAGTQSWFWLKNNYCIEISIFVDFLVDKAQPVAVRPEASTST